MAIQINLLKLSIITLFITNISYGFSQETDTSDNKAAIHKNIHSITYEPFMSFQYTWIHPVNKNLNFGAAIQLGTGARFFIYHPIYHREINSWIDPEEINASSLSYNMELLKLSLLYRKYFSSKAYLDFELFYALSEVFKTRYVFNKMYGVSTSLYWGFGKVEIGHELILGKMDIQYYENPQPNKPAVLVVPLSIRFEF